MSNTETEATATTFGADPRVRRVMGASQPWWPERASAAGKPNVIVVLVDDVGFSDIGCFGGEIETPVLNELAANGLRFTNFHVNPMCSPTRASLLTGLNSHNAAFGHVANSDPGYPGYWSDLPNDVSTLAEILRAEGYATLITGKWHLAREDEISATGPNSSWPCQRGFDRFYGILDGFTNAHQPHYLVEDNHVVEVDRYPDDYYVTDDITTKAIRLIKERKSNNPAQPFFLYLAHPAAHAPLMAKDADIAKYADRYRSGWDALRAERFARQIAEGIVPSIAQLPARNDEDGSDVPAWDELSEAHQELFSRYMAVFAGMVDSIDQNLGRLRDELTAIGEWDNTILLFLSDNGASREGESAGTTSYWHHLGPTGQGIPAPLESDMSRLEDIGTPRTMSHYPRGWAMAGNTPFRLYKTCAHAGGHQVPFVMHWPNGKLDSGAIRGQYQHVIDVVPTLLDLLDIQVPTSRNGVATRMPDGTSFASVVRAADAASTRTRQHYELQGNRAMMADEWEAVTYHQPRTPFVGERWELFDLHNDPTQSRDVSAEHPEKLRELIETWHTLAVENNVYPMDEGSGFRWAVRSPYTEQFEKSITIWPGTPTLEPWRSRRLIWMRSYDVIATVRDLRPSDRGVLVSHGDQGGGYMLYIDDNRATYLYNDGHGKEHRLISEPLGEGSIVVQAAVTPDSLSACSVRLLINGEECGSLSGLHALFPMAPFEGIDIGADRRSPVCWSLAQREGTFAFTGSLEHVRYELGETSRMAAGRHLDHMRSIAERFA